MQPSTGTVGSRIFPREEEVDAEVELRPVHADAALPAREEAGAVEKPGAEENVAPAKECEEDGRKRAAQARILTAAR